MRREYFQAENLSFHFIFEMFGVAQNSAGAMKVLRNQIW